MPASTSPWVNRLTWVFRKREVLAALAVRGSLAVRYTVRQVTAHVLKRRERFDSVMMA